MAKRNNSIKRQIIGTSAVLRDALARLKRAARYRDLTVLILGETGTGKEMAAHYVHEQSGRSGLFCPINCAALPEAMLESELFGHVRGAFTGAHINHLGLFEVSRGGTIFLDEIGEMPIKLQAKILRALQEKKIRRVGSVEEIPVDVRIIAATNRPLRAMVEAGEFREDLLYRLRGYVVDLPPLRERGRDVVLIAKSIIKALPFHKRLSRDAERVLLTHAWPGNIRELQNAIKSAAVDSGRTINAEDLLSNTEDPSEPGGPVASRPDQILSVIDDQGTASPAEIRDATGIAKNTLGRDINRLLAAGIIERLHEGRLVRYQRSGAASSRLHDLNARQQLILREMETSVRITRTEVSALTGTSIRTASRDLARLVELGWLIPDGQTGNAAGYSLAPTKFHHNQKPSGPGSTTPGDRHTKRSQS